MIVKSLLAGSAAAALVCAPIAQAQQATFPTGAGGGVTSSGSITTGHCAQFASGTSISDAGAACGSGSGSAFPSFTAGAWYAMPFTTITGGNALGVGTIYAAIVYFPNPWKAAALATYITTAGTSNFQMAVYATAVSGGVYLPTGAQLCATSNIANTAVGAISGACAVSTQSAGFYAVETAANDATMVCNSINGTGNSQSWFAGSASLTNLISGSLTSSQSLSLTGQTFGTWPNETSSTWSHNAGNRSCPIALQGG